MWLKETRFAVRLGGNTYINVPVLVRYNDEPLFSLARSDDGYLAIDFEVYDGAGQKVATVKHNNIYVGDKTAYSIEGDADRMALIEKASGATLVEIKRRGAATTELDVSVRTYLPNRQLLELGPNATNLGGLYIADNIINGAAIGIQIGRPTSVP